MAAKRIDPVDNTPEGDHQTPTDLLDNRALIARHVQGDALAFSELVQNYRRHVYTYLSRCGVDPSARDDLFQEIFLTVHRNAHVYKDSLALPPWIFTIVANAVRDHFRTRKARLAILPTSNSELPESEALHADAHGEMVARETAAWLDSALARLPTDQREALLLSAVKGLELKSIAKSLGTSINTVKTNVRRARLALGRALVVRTHRLKMETVK